jgi:hypothetical protein
MTDKELLKLAAKASGLEIYFDDVGQCCKRSPQCDPFSTWLWNPIEDNGDALKLAIEMNMQICISSPITYAGFDGRLIVEGHGNDPQSATRRAIVLAAAEMCGSAV